MLDAIVLDVETLNDPETCSTGWATSGLGVGLAVVYESRRDRFQLYDGSRPSQVQRLKDRIAAADIIAGFNIWAFDLPVIFEVNRADWEVRQAGVLMARHPAAEMILAKSLVFDAFRLARIGLGLSPNGGGGSGRGLSMDDVSQQTLGFQAAGGKGLNSSDLPGMLSRCERIEVAEECQQHVRIERDLCRFLLRHGYGLAGGGERFKLEYDADLWTHPLAANLANMVRGSQLI